MYLLSRETIRGRSQELLDLMGLANEEKKLTMEYSHGMRKKLALAAALLPNPDLLFVVLMGLTVLLYLIVLRWQGQVLQAREQQILKVVTSKE